MLLIVLLSCEAKKQQTLSILCPDLFFSRNHRVYITSTDEVLTLDNISYKAIINDYNFEKGCTLQNDTITISLSVFITVAPKNVKEESIILPYYIAFIDDQKNIIDINYYTVTETFKKNTTESSYNEINVKTTNEININSSNSLLIGFMLDKAKQKILN